MKTLIEHIPALIAIESGTLDGDLSLPAELKGLVVFAHGSGSSRHSPRNHYVAGVLNEHSLGTLLVDLLTAEEEREDEYNACLRFDIALLTKRVVAITEWLASQPQATGHTLGLFGASTGAAAALLAAVRLPKLVKAVVSRGGRPDLAGIDAMLVRAPTLLIVGGEDTAVIEMNREAMAIMKCETKLEIVPGASHLFEEPGTLPTAAKLAAQWFANYLK